jgi:hypothetical protein
MLVLTLGRICLSAIHGSAEETAQRLDFSQQRFLNRNGQRISNPAKVAPEFAGCHSRLVTGSKRLTANLGHGLSDKLDSNSFSRVAHAHFTGMQRSKF